MKKFRGSFDDTSRWFQRSGYRPPCQKHGVNGCSTCTQLDPGGFTPDLPMDLTGMQPTVKPPAPKQDGK